MVHSKRQASSSWGGILLVFLVTLAIRVAYLVHYSGMPDWNWLTVDNWYHHNWAGTVADGDLLGGTTYFRAPLYVWLLGALYAVFGNSLWVARSFGLLLGLIAPLLSQRLGTRVFTPEVGIVAGLLHACYPIAVYFDFELLLDPLFTVLLQVGLLALLRWWDSPSSMSAFAVGAAFGLAALCRPTALVLAGLVLAVMLLRTATPLRFKQAAMCAVGLILVIAPVTFRNMAVAGDPVLIASQGGINFYIGNNGSSDGVAAVMPEPFGHNWQIADIIHEAEAANGRQLRPGEVSAHWTDRAVDWISAHPAAFLRHFVTKVALQFSNEEPSNNRNLAEFFDRVPLFKWNPLSFGVLLPFVVLAVAAFAGDNRKVRLLVFLLVVYVLAGALFFVNARFRLPLLPIYFVLAAGGLAALGKLLQPVRVVSLVFILIALAIGLASFLDPWSNSPRRAPITLLARGSEAFDRGDLQTALGHFRKALAVDPEFPEVNLGVGAVFLKQGVADSARHYFAREIALHPDRVKGYTNLASLLLVSGDTVGASELSDAARAIRPHDRQAWRLTFRATRATGPELAALADSADSATRGDVAVLNEAAAALSRSSALSAAERLLQRAITSLPPPVEMNDDAFTREFASGPRAWTRLQGESYSQLGFICGQSGRVGLAVEHSRAALARDSSLVPAWLNLASGLVALGDQAAADSVYTEAVKRFGRDRIASFLPDPAQ